MTEKRTHMVACPACNGERTVATGESYRDEATGAWSYPATECRYCEGIGGVEVDLEPITLDDLVKMAGS